MTSILHVPSLLLSVLPSNEAPAAVFLNSLTVRPAGVAVVVALPEVESVERAGRPPRVEVGEERRRSVRVPHGQPRSRRIGHAFVVVVTRRTVGPNQQSPSTGQQALDPRVLRLLRDFHPI